MIHASTSPMLRLALTILASTAVFTAGCANFASTASGTDALANAATLTGKIHGGNQPVAGATVKIWYVGSGRVLASVGATTTSSTDGTGSFSFTKIASGQTVDTTQSTFSCPTDSTLVYVVATGGNTLNNGNPNLNNTAAVFLAPFGTCSSITPSSFVNMSEVTTVATMAALQQYFNPSSTTTSLATAESFSTDGTGLASRAITNAFGIIPNLVNLSTGNAIISKTIGNTSNVGTGASTVSVVATPETAKINLIANIISACVNNASASATNCTTLFSNATPGDPATTSQPIGTTFATATDVLQATYYMLTNPTDGSTSNLTNLYNLSPATGAPYQPTLGSAPSDWTIAISYSSTSTCGGSTKHFINSVQDLAIDFFGGIWMANSEAGGNLTQLNSDGQPFTCVAVGTGLNTGVTIDAKDSLANIWLADSGDSTVYRYTPAGSGTLLAFPTASAPLSIAADGTGNIFYSSPADTSLYSLPQAATSGAAVSPLLVSNAVGSTPAKIFTDSTKAVWATSGSNFVTRATSATPDTGSGYTSATITGISSPTYGLSVTAFPNSNNFVYIGSSTSNSISNYTGSASTTYAPVASWPVTTLQGPAAIASDGARNVWAINNTAGANSVVEIGAALQNISPTTGFQKSSTFLGNGRSIVIDSSGNVWIGLDGANSITEIVGAAVPVYQPYSYALKNNVFQSIP